MKNFQLLSVNEMATIKGGAVDIDMEEDARTVKVTSSNC